MTSIHYRLLRVVCPCTMNPRIYGSYPEPRKYGRYGAENHLRGGEINIAA